MSRIRGARDAMTASTWTALVKRTIARFARGSIATQNGRILLPEEQERESASARKIAAKWKKRSKAA
jgi:hypothetical protein